MNPVVVIKTIKREKYESGKTSFSSLVGHL